MINIFVANLGRNIEDGDLERAFGEYGEVSSAKVITDRETGESRGFGFVEMPNKEDGEKAIEELNGSMLEGSKLTVNVARPKTEGRGRGGFGGGRGGNRGGFGGGRGDNRGGNDRGGYGRKRY